MILLIGLLPVSHKAKPVPNTIEIKVTTKASKRLLPSNVNPLPEGIIQEKASAWLVNASEIHCPARIKTGSTVINKKAATVTSLVTEMFLYFMYPKKKAPYLSKKVLLQPGG